MTLMRRGRQTQDAPILHSWHGDSLIPQLSELDAPASAKIAGAAMPKAEIRRRTRPYEWSNLESPRWKILKCPNSVIRGDGPVAELRSACAYSEEMNVLLRAALGGTMESPLYSVRIFGEEGDFRRYAVRSSAANAEAFYDPRSAECVFWFGHYPTPEILQRNFAHEFTHAYMDRVWKRTGPLWFAEGMAEYFSNVTWRHGMFVTGNVNRQAVELLRMNNPVPLAEMIAFGREVFYDQHFFRVLYAQAWSVVYFLFHRHPEVIRDLLDGMLVDLTTIETEWREYLGDVLLRQD